MYVDNIGTAPMPRASCVRHGTRTVDDTDWLGPGDVTRSDRALQETI
jgi:hypothetical protein